MKKYFICFILLSLSACTRDSKQVTNLLTADGVTEIQLTGYSPFTCSDSDTFADGFKGLKNGKRVEGVVCSGFLKGSTIRYTKVN